MSIVKAFSFPCGNIRGNTFYIKHNSNNFTVIDCYLKDGDDASCRKEEITKEIIRESNGRVCRFISTHPDNDHILGIDYLDQRWQIKNFYTVENMKPEDKSDKDLTKYLQLMKKHNYPIKRGIRRCWLNQDNENNKSSGIQFQWPPDTKNQKFEDALKNVKDGKSPNNISPIFTYSVPNGATYMWLGDLDTDMQQEYYNTYKNDIPQIDILFQPHHGRESSTMPKELLDVLNPKLIIIGNAPSKYINYGDPSKTITQNSAGDIIFENKDNMVHVYTKKRVDNIPNCINKIQNHSNLNFLGWYYCGTLKLK